MSLSGNPFSSVKNQKRQALSPEEIEILRESADLLLDNIPPGVDLTLVGGRALEFWASTFSPMYPEEFENSITSATKDIDFVIQERDHCSRCAQYWIPLLNKAGINASIDAPSIDHITPEASVIRIQIGSNPDFFPLSDFLFDLAGITKSTIHNNKTFLKDGLCVLTPYMVLLNRIQNVLKIREKQKEHGFSQVDVSFAVARANIRYLLDSNENKDIRQALAIHNKIVKLAKSKKVGVKLFREFSIDLTDALITKHPNLPDAFISTGWPNQLAAIKKARNEGLQYSSDFEP